MTHTIRCVKCNQEKTLDQMHVHRVNSEAPVISTWCRVCRNAAMKEGTQK